VQLTYKFRNEKDAKRGVDISVVHSTSEIFNMLLD